MADSDFQYNRTIGSQKTDFRKIGFEEYFYFIFLVNNLEGVNYNSCKIAKKSFILRDMSEEALPVEIF